jgi:hypothetical protein
LLTDWESDVIIAAMNVQALASEHERLRYMETREGHAMSVRWHQAVQRLVDISSRQTAKYVGAARDGIEAQHGLNDTYPGDPYP